MATTRAAMAQWARGSRERDAPRARDRVDHVTNHESLDGCPQRACQQAGPGVPLEKRLRCMDSVVAASPPRPYICTTLVQMHQDGAAPERGDEGARFVEVLPGRVERGSIQSDWINRPATALSAASAFRRWSSAVSPPLRCGTTTSSRSGTPCRRACVRAAVSKLSQTIVTVWRPRFSRAAASSTLPHVHEPQSPMPTTAPAAPSRAASIRSGGEGAVPDGFPKRRTLAPKRSASRASRWVVNGMSRLSSTRAIVAPWSVRGRDLGGRSDVAAGQTGLRISIVAPHSPRAPDRAGDGETAEAAPPREDRGEIAPAAGHDDVDVPRPGGGGQPGGGAVEVVAVHVAVCVPLHF